MREEGGGDEREEAARAAAVDVEGLTFSVVKGLTSSQVCCTGTPTRDVTAFNPAVACPTTCAHTLLSHERGCECRLRLSAQNPKP